MCVCIILGVCLFCKAAAQTPQKNGHCTPKVVMLDVLVAGQQKKHREWLTGPL